MENPLISIIVPVYNGSNYIKDALNCLVNQTYKNIEILVINDGSKDEGKTKEAVAPFLVDQRIHYIEKDNGGVSSALNLGIEKMTGKFFVWLSHDDVITTDSLEQRFNKWVECGSNEKIMISTKTKYINANGKKIFRVASGSKNVNNIYDILSSTINGCSLLIPASLIKNHKFNEEMIYMQDYYLWANFISNGACIKVVNKKLTYNRIHKAQVTTTKFDCLIRDFDTFANAYIEPLKINKDYKQITKITYTLAAHSGVKPFFKGYVKGYVNFLKDNKQWNIAKSIILSFKKLEAASVALLRKI